MWHLRTILIAMAGILLLLVPGVHADSLQLKNGNFVQGKYLGGSERAVQFEANGKIRLYDIGEILSISFAAASADGGIPSNDGDAKPNTNTELSSAARDDRGSRAALGNQAKTTISWPADHPKREPEQQQGQAAGRAGGQTSATRLRRSGGKFRGEGTSFGNPHATAPNNSRFSSIRKRARCAFKCGSTRRVAFAPPFNPEFSLSVPMYS